ncbi:glycosyltransferase [Nostocoides sp. F2B08]|uniref:glycosyltransferase family 2 protein n=1 Tax=Nostocoides sp. F2B08 TaxID=2653936 RepID=UPI001263B958|nr:glycosyltransferase [Tetrasphaera sp. F2B08]KAB7744832.1 glycosyltransferase [Tetrasphaera sp. F2B08]
MPIRLPSSLRPDRVKQAMRSPYAAPVRGAYRLVTAANLGLVRVVDARRAPSRTAADRQEVAERVTIAVKTFERPAMIRRFLRSARRVFDGRIVVADDSRQPVGPSGPWVDVIALPFNSGVAVGRNAALAAVETEFVFVCDDDIVLTALTDLAVLMDYLDHNPQVDIVGVALVDLPVRKLVDRSTSPLFAGAGEPRIPLGTVIDELPVVGKVAQVYLGRTEAVRAVGWDERLRMVDHRDFFSRASGRLVTVQHDRVLAYHAQTPFDASYARYREDVADDLTYLGRKWSPTAGRSDDT